ncbi:chromate transporter [Caldifermentibacillus hisashii]|jgi:chromate transporter|uniref:Chromate transporter n=2 Tax=Bacillaceae TaxID=186817 RepID=A0A090IYC0_9BACI|nr:MULTISPECIES: chromate transporter [Bacillaceae]MBU5342512.1 chromate transporter [Caldifermentibacillus hisashii]MCB7069049.1 chromate transporter [Caldibacillus sp. 210928-DFI.2.22]MCB7072331.1 chromate transporter [Caldibacillus sp. 210928-DFI.2.18]MCM3054543.1 chromate transporter [Caldibacillus thermoamylovorans]MCM3476783.1 chromate transporter [Caldibacillus thermoamylovorans]
MIYWNIFLAFFIPGILGYGGGPASIPLVENEVVDRYGWYTVQEFSQILALGNSLPGPIATKMAGYIGYDVGGVLGAIIAVFATVAPSLILMIILLKILLKYKNSPKVKRLTSYVRPIIAILLGVMAWDFFVESYEGIGIWQTVGIGVISFFMIERWRIHPAIVIVAAFVYGGLVLG